MYNFTDRTRRATWLDRCQSNNRKLWEFNFFPFCLRREKRRGKKNKSGSAERNKYFNPLPAGNFTTGSNLPKLLSAKNHSLRSKYPLFYYTRTPLLKQSSTLTVSISLFSLISRPKKIIQKIQYLPTELKHRIPFKSSKPLFTPMASHAESAKAVPFRLSHELSIYSP